MGMRVGLLNPGDEISVSIITNQNIQLRFYSKSEGVSVIQGRNSIESRVFWGWVRIAALLAVPCFGFILIKLVESRAKNDKKIEQMELMLSDFKKAWKMPGPRVRDLKPGDKLTDAPDGE